MSETGDSERGNSLSNLMDEKLGRFRFWTAPEVADHVGPRNLSILDRFDQYRRKIVEACENKLSQFSDEEISIIVTHNLDDPKEIGNEWHGWQRDEIYRLNKIEPTWVQTGFGHANYEADFSYWGLMETLSLHEALMLSVGVDPKHFSNDVLSKIRREKKLDQFPPTIHFLLKRYEIFARKFPIGYEGFSPVSFRFLKHWFDEVEMIIHPSFRDVVERRNSQKSAEGTMPVLEERTGATKELSMLERQTALKLIAAMACQGYRYDPARPRNSATTDIQNDVAAIGHSIDPKTILKWLKEATELVDAEYWEGSDD